MVTIFSCKELVMNSRDACCCGPLPQCQHERQFRPLTMKNWLRNVSAIQHVQNKQGRVYFCNIGNEPCVVKHFNKSSLSGHVDREHASGQLLNTLNLPWFVQSLGVFYRNSGPYNVTRFVDGVSMKQALPTMTRLDFFSIVSQLCVALEKAQKEFFFGHYDLHLENIILQEKATDVRHMTFDEYVVEFSNDVLPVIIDFGMSCGQRHGRTWGLSGLESKSIFQHLLPGYDMFCFFLYCQQQHSNVESIVETVLKEFFLHEPKTNYLKSLERHASSKTPKQLFDFIFKKGWLTERQCKPRDVYTLDKKDNVIDDGTFYINYMYYNIPFVGDATKAIENDIYLLKRNRNICFLLRMYYKIVECNLSEQYESWVKSFTPLLNKYWVSKTKYYAKKRLQWQYHVTGNANVCSQ